MTVTSANHLTPIEVSLTVPPPCISIYRIHPKAAEITDEYNKVISHPIMAKLIAQHSPHELSAMQPEPLRATLLAACNDTNRDQDLSTLETLIEHFAILLFTNSDVLPNPIFYEPKRLIFRSLPLILSHLQGIKPRTTLTMSLTTTALQTLILWADIVYVSNKKDLATQYLKVASFFNAAETPKLQEHFVVANPQDPNTIASHPDSIVNPATKKSRKE